MCITNNMVLSHSVFSLDFILKFEFNGRLSVNLLIIICSDTLQVANDLVIIFANCLSISINYLSQQKQTWVRKTDHALNPTHLTRHCGLEMLSRGLPAPYPPNTWSLVAYSRNNESYASDDPLLESHWLLCLSISELLQTSNTVNISLRL